MLNSGSGWYSSPWTALFCIVVWKFWDDKSVLVIVHDKIVNCHFVSSYYLNNDTFFYMNPDDLNNFHWKPVVSVMPWILTCDIWLFPFSISLLFSFSLTHGLYLWVLSAQTISLAMLIDFGNDFAIWIDFWPRLCHGLWLLA